MSIQLKVFALLLCLVSSSYARADVEVLPQSHHQQFQTYGLYIDQQSTLIYRDGGRAWGGLGGSIALLGDNDMQFKPQLVVHGTANAAYRLDKATLLTETIDARVGLALDFQFDDTFRGMIMWTHQSGHVTDNISDMDLFGSNLGNEIIDFRVVKDIEEKWRVGVGFRPTVGSDPGMCVIGGEEFAEYFPLGEAQDTHHFKPYISLGLEQYGRGSIQQSTNVQIGYAAGSHFKKDKAPSLRVVIGYYNGNDPRMKYYQFKYSRVDYAYGGLMFDI